jgi:hypothetical protein
MPMTITGMRLSLIRKPGVSSAFQITGTDLQVGFIIKIQNAARTRTWLGSVVKVNTARDNGIAVVQFLQPTTLQVAEKEGIVVTNVEILTITITSVVDGVPPVNDTTTSSVEVYDIP